jgi:hypothetical protein
MQEKYGPEVRQHAIKSEQHVAYHCESTRWHDGVHAEVAKNRECYQVSDDVRPRHCDIPCRLIDASR